MLRVLRIAALAATIPLSGGGATTGQQIVVIAAANSPIEELAHEEIADIFLGRKARLADGTRVIPLDQPEGSAARDAFYLEYTGKSAAQVKAHWSKIIFTGKGQPPAQARDAEAARARVAKNPSLLAYVPRQVVDDTVRVVSD